MAGSIAVWAQPGDTLWGTGNAHNSLVGKIVGEQLTIRAVRGPLTRDRLMAVGADVPPIYGDPALLAPRFYDRPQEVKHDLGLVPHYWDLKERTWPAFSSENPHVISPMRSLDELPAFIDAIRGCQRIVSSSLHGMIFAHAYGIPARWVRLSDRVHGGRLKFDDYLLSVGIEPYDPRWPRSSDFSAPDLQLDLDPLWNARPWA